MEDYSNGNVRYDHVTKQFSETVKAVNDLSLDIKDKEFLVLVGPSGLRQDHRACAFWQVWKTSPRAPSASAIAVNDVAPEGPRYCDGVSVVCALSAHVRLRQYGVRTRSCKMSKTDIDKRVKEAAGILGINHLLDRKPKQLSGGQRQRSR